MAYFLDVRDRTVEIDPERDFIHDQIKKLVQFVARLLDRSPPTIDVQPALDELLTTATKILGVPIDILERLTPSSAARMLNHDGERLSAYIAVVEAEGRLLKHVGDHVAAQQRALRAQALTMQLRN
ncbi:MAG TPA: hypothetical protein VGF45_08260 [Polyangia bacterium]